MTSRIRFGTIVTLNLTLLSGCALLGPDHQTPATRSSSRSVAGKAPN